MSMIEKALAIALEAYAGKTDKGGKAYILHPLRLMARMPNERAMATALLHDVIEDSDITADELCLRGIPADVVAAVECLSRGKKETYEDFIERIRENHFAREIKLADIEDNLNVLRLDTLCDADLRRVEKYHRAWHRLSSASPISQ